MKRFLSLVFLLASLSTFAQAPSDTIEKEGRHYYYHGLDLTSKEFTDVLNTNPDSKLEMKKARNNESVAKGLSYGAGLMIGYPIGAAIGGGKPEWPFYLGVGAGLVLIAIPCAIAYKKHTKKAVLLFNDRVKRVAYRSVDVNLGFTLTGIKLQIRL